MRNDAEELRLREGRLPVIPEVPEWNPQASIPPDFRVNERSMAALSPSVTYTPPPRSLGGSLNAMGELSRLDPRIADKYRTVTVGGSSCYRIDGESYVSNTCRNFCRYTSYSARR